MLLDESTDLGCDLGPIPSHNQHLTNGPGVPLAAVSDGPRNCVQELYLLIIHPSIHSPIHPSINSSINPSIQPGSRLSILLSPFLNRRRCSATHQATDGAETTESKKGTTKKKKGNDNKEYKNKHTSRGFAIVGPNRRLRWPCCALAAAIGAAGSGTMLLGRRRHNAPPGGPGKAPTPSS